MDVNEIQAFTSQLDALLKAGRLTPAAAQTLLAAAQAVMLTLSQ
jgi:hypothetical protein